MANIKSQIKRNRQNEKRRVRNKAVRSELKTRTKRALTRAEQGTEKPRTPPALAMKRIDKAAAKGVIHKNAAARRKSRLMRRVNATDRPDLRAGRRAAPRVRTDMPLKGVPRGGCFFGLAWRGAWGGRGLLGSGGGRKEWVLVVSEGGCCYEGPSMEADPA